MKTESETSERLDAVQSFSLSFHFFMSFEIQATKGFAADSFCS